MLLANEGTLDGRSIIPVGWVREATTPSGEQFEAGQTRTIFGYGYQTWILPGEGRQFVLRGLRGQAVFVDPQSKLVMVHTLARDVGDSGREVMPLWLGVVQSLGK
jgi:CubicO group peptidase (beta-lactamase class C family)